MRYDDGLINTMDENIIPDNKVEHRMYDMMSELHCFDFMKHVNGRELDNKSSLRLLIFM